MGSKLSGANSVLEAIRSRRHVHRIYILEGKSSKKYDEILRLAKQRGIFVQEVERSRLDQMYKEGNHQGVVALVDDYEYATVEEILEKAYMQKESPFILILDGIEDPQNLGAIIRTAECAGVHGIVLPRHSSSDVTETVSRTSAGAVEHMLIARVKNLVETIKLLKSKGMWVVGADMEANQDLFSANIPLPVVLVVGGEDRGIRRLVKENCDLLVKIPLCGKISSLNASIAAAVCIYEVLKRQSK